MERKEREIASRTRRNADSLDKTKRHHHRPIIALVRLRADIPERDGFVT